MKKTTGGTDIYCPNCESIQTCKASQDILDNLKGHRDQRYSNHDGDIHWFERGRECLRCKNQFVSIELLENHLHELQRLRKKSRFLDIYKMVFAQKLTAVEQMEKIKFFLDDIKNESWLHDG